MSKNQCEKIVDYIKEFGSITSFDAFIDLGCSRLASRICDLKKQGYEIQDKFEKSVNRFGEKVTYKRYFLKGE